LTTRGSDADTLLRRAVSDLLEDQESDSVRDSDVKRRMLALDSEFDEGKLGFPKFSRFLKDAQERGVIALTQGEEGQGQVSLVSVSLVSGTAPTEVSVPAFTPPISERQPPAKPSGTPVSGGRLRPREDSRRRPRAGEGEAPPLFEGQVVPRAGAHPPASPPTAEPADGGGVISAPMPIDVERLRLPTDPENVVRYLTNSYGGVGRKTAEALVETLGDRVFTVLANDPDRVKRILPTSRADLLLQGWEADLKRRRERFLTPSEPTGAPSAESIAAPAENQLVEGAQAETEGTGAASEWATRRRGRRTRGSPEAG
jgi:hypothetical protein